MQTQVQKEKSVRLGNWVLKINNVNVWLIRSAEFSSELKVAQIIADNGKLPPRRKLSSATFKATLLEIDLDNMRKIFGWELTTVPEDQWQGIKKKKVLTYDDLIKAIDLYPVEFMNDSEGKKFGIKFFKAYAKSSIALNFPSDEELDKTMELPIEFEAFPNDDNKLFEIIDEQNVD